MAESSSGPAASKRITSADLKDQLVSYLIVTPTNNWNTDNFITNYRRLVERAKNIQSVAKTEAEDEMKNLVKSL